jgi:gag-polypeptide of LTR copia-type
MGVKGLWRHIERTASAPVPFPMTNGVAMLADGKTVATEEQLEQKESKIIEFKKREYLAHYILVSTTSTCLTMKIKGLSTAKDMWNTIKDDATSKSTLYLLDAEDQLSSIKLVDNNDPKTHFNKLKTHFQLMLQHRNNLMKIGLTMSDNRFNIIVMSSLPGLYRPILQTITTVKRVNKLLGMQATTMNVDDLMAFISSLRRLNTALSTTTKQNLLSLLLR